MIKTTAELWRPQRFYQYLLTYPGTMYAFVNLNGNLYFGDYHEEIFDALRLKEGYDYKTFMSLPQFWGWAKYSSKDKKITVTRGSDYFQDQTNAQIPEVEQLLNKGFQAFLAGKEASIKSSSLTYLEKYPPIINDYHPYIYSNGKVFLGPSRGDHFGLLSLLLDLGYLTYAQVNAIQDKKVSGYYYPKLKAFTIYPIGPGKTVNREEVSHAIELAAREDRTATSLKAEYVFGGYDPKETHWPFAYDLDTNRLVYGRPGGYHYYLLENLLGQKGQGFTMVPNVITGVFDPATEEIRLHDASVKLGTPEILENIKSALLTAEQSSPHISSVEWNGYWNEEKTYPFIYSKGKLWMGHYGGSHWDIINQYDLPADGESAGDIYGRIDPASGQGGYLYLYRNSGTSPEVEQAVEHWLKTASIGESTPQVWEEKSIWKNSDTTHWILKFIDNLPFDPKRSQYGYPVIADNKSHTAFIGSLGAHHYNLLDSVGGFDDFHLHWYNIWPPGVKQGWGRPTTGWEAIPYEGGTGDPVLKMRLEEWAQTQSQRQVTSAVIDMTDANYGDHYSPQGPYEDWCFGWVNGDLYIGDVHHAKIIAALVQEGKYTWETLMTAPQMWGWLDFMDQAYYPHQMDQEENISYTGSLRFASDDAMQSKGVKMKVIADIKAAFPKVVKWDIPTGYGYTSQKDYGQRAKEQYMPEELYKSLMAKLTPSTVFQMTSWSGDPLQYKVISTDDEGITFVDLEHPDDEEYLMWEEIYGSPIEVLKQGSFHKTAGTWKYLWGDGKVVLDPNLKVNFHHYMMVNDLVEELGHIPEKYVAGVFSEDPFHGPQYDHVSVKWSVGRGVPSPDELRSLIHAKLNQG